VVERNFKVSTRMFESLAEILGTRDGGRRRPWLVSALAWGLIPALTLGLCLGCGGGDEATMAGPPEGMELAQPVPPPPPSAEDALGSAADSGSQAPPSN
jgi:hypothetical protein